MIPPQTALAAHDEANASVGELLRTRALTNSPPWLFGQLVAGVAINTALLVWFPKGWGIATAGMATVLLHALWSVAVRRTSDVVRDVNGDEAAPDYSARSVWWPVRRIAAIAGSASALVLLWFVCLFMLGRLMS
jgi:hypothetical protein